MYRRRADKNLFSGGQKLRIPDLIVKRAADPKTDR